MAAKTVLNYLPRESVIHKLTGTTKLAFFLLFTFASMITYNTWVLLGLFAVSLAAFKLSKIKFREVRFMMIFMLVFLVLNNLFIFLFDPNQGTTLYGTRHVLCHLFWRYDLTAEHRTSSQSAALRKNAFLSSQQVRVVRRVCRNCCATACANRNSSNPLRLS